MGSVPKPRDGKRFYWCPRCRRGHMRNSKIGHFHKAYVEMARVQRNRENREAGGSGMGSDGLECEA